MLRKNNEVDENLIGEVFNSNDDLSDSGDYSHDEDFNSVINNVINLASVKKGRDGVHEAKFKCDKTGCKQVTSDEESDNDSSDKSSL